MDDEKPLHERLLSIEDLDASSAAERKAKFLAHFSNTCNVTKSAKAVGVHRSCVYLWKKEDEQFAIDFEDAKEVAVEALEDEMHRRAMDGVLKVNKYGTYREYSDTLAIFLAKAHKPEKYSERIRNEITGAGGKPLELDDSKLALKLNGILNNVMQRKTQAEQAETEDDGDFDDLC